MLLEVSVENFLSYKDRVSFSMLADGTEGLDSNYQLIKDKKILKTAAMYGANASGKSNLFKIISLAVNMIHYSNNFDINSTLPVTPFFSRKNEPSSFEIIFYKNDVKYVYGFVADKEAVHEEYLYYYPKGRQAKIFDRTNITDFSFPKEDAKVLGEISKFTNKNKFFLSTATNWNYSKTKPAYDFMTIDLNICSDVEDLSLLAYNLYDNKENKELKKFALDFLKKADINIIDYKIKLIDIPKEHLKNIPEPYRNLENKVFDITFTHLVDEKKYELDFDEESLGTKTIFILIPFISMVLDSKRVLIIDELDKSLHPLLVELIVTMFNNPEINKNGAQLIFNTHDTNLLNLNLLRRDQIWFVEKSEKTGSSDLYAMSDFSKRENENIEQGYLLGRYGAIPFINLDINLWQQKEN